MGYEVLPYASFIFQKYVDELILTMHLYLQYTLITYLTDIYSMSNILEVLKRPKKKNKQLMLKELHSVV